jgi:hypothetical protein
MSRGKDPFNFDDLYRQEGVDNLFVKKSMGEMKKPPSNGECLDSPGARLLRFRTDSVDWYTHLFTLQGPLQCFLVAVLIKKL